jgi:hypothetical protein
LFIWFCAILSQKLIWEWSFLSQKTKELSCVVHKIVYIFRVLRWNIGHCKDEKRKRNRKWVLFCNSGVSNVVWMLNVAWVINYMEYVLCNIFFLVVCVKSCLKWKQILVPWDSKISGLYCIYSFIDIYVVNYKTCGREHYSTFSDFLVVITAFVKTGTALILFIFYTIILLRKEF